MQKKFSLHVEQLISNCESKKLLVAASSGIDSTVLIHLCHKINLKIGVCHVNYQLRKEESNKDQIFLDNLSKDLNLPFYNLTKNAKQYARINQLSIQESAREIRYTWFEQCLDKYDYDYILTAHHVEDDIETFFINTFRGTGINGLIGMPTKRNKILKPLLPFTKTEITEFATKNNIQWREDSSNQSDKYLRNVIRHHLLPFFKDRNDNFLKRFQNTQSNLKNQHTLLEDYKKNLIKKIISIDKSVQKINIKVLKKTPNYHLVLKELLKDYGFKDWKSMQRLLEGEKGKFINSPTHTLVKENGFLELFVHQKIENKLYNINISNLPQKVAFELGNIVLEKTKDFKKTTPNIAYLNLDLLTENLKLRTYQKGDFFHPLGMNGKRKLSDFFKDEKLTTFEKMNTYVLTHQNAIIWVVNHRINHKYRITNTTKECLRIKFIPY